MQTLNKTYKSGNRTKDLVMDMRNRVFEHISGHYSVDVSDIEYEQEGTYAISEKQIEHIVEVFNLSEFELNILLLCIATEIDPIISLLFSRLGNNFAPSISFASELFPEIEHAITNRSPLRFWRLVELKNPEHFLHSHFHVSEKVIHFALGVETVEEKVVDVLADLEVDRLEIKPSQRLQQQYELQVQDSEKNSMPIQMQSWDAEEIKHAASFFAQKKGYKLYKFSLEDFGKDKKQQDHRLLGREILMDRAMLWIDCNELVSATDERRYALFAFVNKMAAELSSRIILSAPAPLSQHKIPVELIELKERTPIEQSELWKQKLAYYPELISEEEIDKTSQHFKLSLQQTGTIADQWNSQMKHETGGKNGFDTLWNLSRMNLRRNTTDRINLVESTTKRDGLVLSQKSKKLFDQFLAQAQGRYKVYEEWGLADKLKRGLGIAALFYGPSGTGKTTAAEVLASELQLDILKIDLSQTVSKYIGETEKNLDHAFHVAHQSGAILMFDEADSVFTKRTAIHDSHDVHANQQVSYLLQKIETHPGISILTTNLKNSIDEAFMRRIRFVIPFDLPDVDERYKIWKGIFPLQVPKEEIDLKKLARYGLSGGEIKNAAVNATFFAAEKDCSLNMRFIEAAINDEFEKNEKPISIE